jgi:hypothetical protein
MYRQYRHVSYVQTVQARLLCTDSKGTSLMHKQYSQVSYAHSTGTSLMYRQYRHVSYAQTVQARLLRTDSTGTSLMYRQYRHISYVQTVQARLFLHDFASIRDLENSHHFSYLCDNVWFNTNWHRRHRRYIVNCGLMQCGIHNLWLHVLCVGGYQEVTSLSHHQCGGG